MTVAVLVPAAGTGRRMGGARKPFLELAGRSVLAWALAPFLARDDVVEVVVALGANEALPQGSSGDAEDGLADARVRAVRGGRTRFESVAAAFGALRSRAGVVAVHDGARPFPPASAIEACIGLARTGVGAVAGLRATDTIKEVDAGDLIVATPPRARLWQAQTPQVFPRGAFERAVHACRKEGREPTDDAAAVELEGFPVQMVASPATNLKITRPADLAVAEALIACGIVS